MYILLIVLLSTLCSEMIYDGTFAVRYEDKVAHFDRWTHPSYGRIYDDREKYVTFDDFYTYITTLQLKENITLVKYDSSKV